MAIKDCYITVRLDIENPDVDEITDNDAEYVVSKLDYSFTLPDGGFSIYDTTICGIND